MPSTVTVHAWPDPILDTIGHDPRSAYVETFWLPTLGPTALLLLRHVAHRLDHEPKRFELELTETCRALGLGAREGSASPVMKSFDRLTLFDLACSDGSGNLAVRRNVPPVNARHVRRLPRALQDAHVQWSEDPVGEDPTRSMRQRARRMAFTLIEQGDDLDHVERVLHATGFHPSVCRDASSWAWQRHRDALAAALSQPSSRSGGPSLLA